MIENKVIPEVLEWWAVRHGFDCSDINSRIDNGMTPLMLAAMHGEMEIVRLLLYAGANTRYLNDDENNALWFGCVSNQIKIVRELLEFKTPIDNQNVNGATALIYCASTGKYEILCELVEQGADIHKQTLDGFNALDSATTLPILNYLKPHYANRVA